MALKSMTGFGSASARAPGARISVELSAVNRRQLDVVLRLPPALAAFESRAHQVIQESISRGRISGSMHLDTANGQGAMRIDHKRAAALVQQLRRAARKLDLKDDLSASLLLHSPGLLKTDSGGPPPEVLFECAEKALRAALRKLGTMRAREGRALETELQARLQTLAVMLGAIEQRAPQMVAARRRKLHQALRAEGMKAVATDERVLREIALFAERCDIAEEITRLASHLRQFKKIMRAGAPSGRPLDFLSQEMLREINTIGSKSGDLKIAQQTVLFKAELERIREQVQNVE